MRYGEGDVVKVSSLYHSYAADVLGLVLGLFKMTRVGCMGWIGCELDMGEIL
jgi:hypothetical protein